ncbi:MAG: leucyl aminopeptidase family protein [Hyphomicrobiaceae bacterium]|nr:leucyl aminopeptidase family protein [Hyphomicrobiaceae bacterium]
MSVTASPGDGPEFPDVGHLFLVPEDAATARAATPVWLLGEADHAAEVAGLSEAQARWLTGQRFTGAARRQAIVPAPDGTVAGVALGSGNGLAGDPCGPSELLLGSLAQSLPPGDYRLAAPPRTTRADTDELAAVAWGLGAYRFQRYRSGSPEPRPRLVVPEGTDAKRIAAIVEAVWFGRDLINTPACDMSPDDIESAARMLAGRHGARIAVITDDELLARNFPMIHAVGRASNVPPRLIDLRWQPRQGGSEATTLTLVGKGISFDTGGLDIKPSSGMLLMKKDMGGAASALALGHMIMALELPVRLRILIPAAENAISGNAFRPGDVLVSRAGTTVEIGNTDAEGRLVLGDALTYAGEENPDIVISLATLTGAARVALGPDLPALFCDDDALAARILAAGAAVGDPLWRMPFWPGYEKGLDSEVADMGNVSDGPFAGAITAALFLRRFAKGAGRYAHIDLFAWRPSQRPLGPKGGEPHAARALLAALMEEVAR